MVGGLALIDQRFVDALIAFPGNILAIAIMAALGVSINNVVFAVAVAYIPSAARIIGAQALGIKEMAYILAAWAVGVPWAVRLAMAAVRFSKGMPTAEAIGATL